MKMMNPVTHIRGGEELHYVLSDIHGNSAAFDTILSMIKLQPDDRLYILGDVVDRGPDGIELLQRIRQMENCVLLLGNHEYMMINAMRNRNDDWAMRVWRKNGCQSTKASFSALDAEVQEDLLQYLEGLPLQTSVTVQSDAGDKEYILVHAAPIELYESVGRMFYIDVEEYQVWHRLPMKKAEELEGKTLIFGHTPTDNVQFSEWPKMRIAHGDGVIDIDCGCAYPQYCGQLGCLRLEDGMEFYSEEGIVTRTEAAAWKVEQMEQQRRSQS